MIKARTAQDGGEKQVTPDRSVVEQILPPSRDYDLYPIATAFKIYKSALEQSRCKKIRDGSFFDAKRTWERLLKDFPIEKKAERRLMPSAFEKDAQRVYEEVAGSNLKASAEELWSLLEVRLCNKAHRSALQDKFFNLKWNERKESVATYAERLHSDSIALPTATTTDVLLNLFKSGLPQKWQDQAVLVTGDFDTVVSSVSRLSTAQQASAREPVREIGESSTSAGIRVQPTTSSAADDRFAHVKCYYCQRLGHIARFCEKRRRIG